MKIKFREAFEKTKNFFKGKNKKNLIVACSVVVIGTAIILNLALFGGGEKDGFDYSSASGMTGGNTITNSDGLVNSSAEEESDSYFAVSQINRKRARDEAMEVLQSVVDNESAAADAKERALNEIGQIAADMEHESNIETLVISKGFEECVAVVSGGTVSVIVKSDELLDSEISQINEIVYEQTGIDPEDIKIIRK